MFLDSCIASSTQLSPDACSPLAHATRLFTDPRVSIHNSTSPSVLPTIDPKSQAQEYTPESAEEMIPSVVGIPYW